MDKIDRFLDAIEHPEHYTPVELETMLQDPEVKEMFDLLDKTKSSLQTLQTPDIEAEWKSFEKNHLTSKVTHRFWLAGIMPRNVAATITIAIVSFTAVAAIVGIGIDQLNQRQEASVPADVKTEYAKVIAKPDSVKSVEAVNNKIPEIVVFDNEPLKTIAHKIAEYYGYEVEFNNEASKSLRLYFRWNQANTVEEVIESLDNFEQIQIEIIDKTIKIA
ncbi:MAG: DUF4974 domain-containing protein [Muribaculaceae bacterium]|nr:DUF4974 domain-containing protein [Muribaculaceae bacterium]